MTTDEMSQLKSTLMQLRSWRDRGQGTLPPILDWEFILGLLLKTYELQVEKDNDAAEASTTSWRWPAGCVPCEGECGGFRLPNKRCAIRRCSGGDHL
jgi:hypothetical protein